MNKERARKDGEQLGDELSEMIVSAREEMYAKEADTLNTEGREISKDEALAILQPAMKDIARHLVKSMVRMTVRYAGEEALRQAAKEKGDG